MWLFILTLRHHIIVHYPRALHGHCPRATHEHGIRADVIGVHNARFGARVGSNDPELTRGVSKIVQVEVALRVPVDGSFVEHEVEQHEGARDAVAFGARHQRQRLALRGH